jgi:hypothetical protein
VFVEARSELVVAGGKLTAIRHIWQWATLTVHDMPMRRRHWECGC